MGMGEAVYDVCISSYSCVEFLTQKYAFKTLKIKERFLNRGL